MDPNVYISLIQGTANHTARLLKKNGIYTAVNETHQ